MENNEVKKTSNKSVVILSIALIITSISIIVLGITITNITATNNKLDERVRTLEVKTLENTQDIQFVLYVGTNDKDTNEPVMSNEEAKAAAKEILLRHFGGYTIQEAEGGWKDGDKVYKEYTMVIYLSDTSIGAVHKAADELIDKFHQSSILIQSNKTSTEFYSKK